MSTQLRLVDPVEPTPPAAIERPSRRKAPTARARTTRTARARQVRWDTTWRLDSETRRTGRRGVAAARAALARATPPEAELEQAS